MRDARAEISSACNAETREARRDLQHVEFEGPARIADVLIEAGLVLDVRALYRGDQVPSQLDRGDVLVVMGGPMGVADLDDPAFPFLARELDLLRQTISDDAPMLGVCLGAQLLAHAGGAAVYPMSEAKSGRRIYEVGFSPASFEVHQGLEVLEGLPPLAPVLHWHGDTFDLPAGSRLLASTPVCRAQGFQLGRRQFGLQFHCESRADDVTRFLHADGAFVEKANGVGSIERLREETARYMLEFREMGDRLLRNIVRIMCRD